MNKPIFILICLFVSFEVKSKEKVLKCHVEDGQSNLYYLDTKNKYFGLIPFSTKGKEFYKNQITKNYKETKQKIQTWSVNVIDGLNILNHLSINRLDGAFIQTLVNFDENGEIIKEKSYEGECVKYDGKQKF